MSLIIDNPLADARFADVVTRELRKGLTAQLMKQAEADLDTLVSKYKAELKATIETEVQQLAVQTVSKLYEHITGDTSIGVTVKLIK